MKVAGRKLQGRLHDVADANEIEPPQNELARANQLADERIASGPRDDGRVALGYDLPLAEDNQACRELQRL